MGGRGGEVVLDSRFQPSLVGSWKYLMRTVPNITGLLQPLEDVIRHWFLPSLTGRINFSDNQRELLALPARLGGLGIINPTSCSQHQFNSSSMMSDPLVSLIQQKANCYPEPCRAETNQSHNPHVELQCSQRGSRQPETKTTSTSASFQLVNSNS